MLFNSFAFLLVFLPAAFLAYAVASRFDAVRLPVLLAVSLIFYSYWDWRFAFLIVPSIGINWLAAQVYLRWRLPWVVPAAVGLNLGVLGAFKYAGFFAVTINRAAGLDLPVFNLALPLGISFFSFHHIMYLVDLAGGRAPKIGIVRYGLYIAFFPQVLAGPLVRWSEVLHQFDLAPFRAGWRERVSRGLVLLILGLAKKVLVADALIKFIDPVFAAAGHGASVSAGDAWGATLAFAFQIYFDFSGYTDMALGIALMFGIVLPQNFDAPYRAASIQSFWRRWHMTLSRFLRDYLYVPLGGNRRGLPRQLAALMATMTLGGLWHGAGLPFVAWGAAHGLALAAGVAWRRGGLTMPPLAGWCLTQGFVVLAWVLFRAQTFDTALAMYRALLGLGGQGHCGDCVTPAWRVFVVPAFLAIVGPTAWTIATRIGPHRWIALVLVVLAIVELLVIGDDVDYEFIYFRF